MRGDVVRVIKMKICEGSYKKSFNLTVEAQL